MKPTALATFLAPLALAPLASAGGVRIVEPTGTRWYPTIGAAVAAAQDGDALLVAAGSYPGFTVSGKSLSVHALPGAQVDVTPPIFVTNLAATQAVVLSGLRVAPESPMGDNALLRIEGCAGDVRVERSVFQAANFDLGFCFGIPFPDGDHGAFVASAAAVAFQGCTFVGGQGEGRFGFEDPCFPAGDGGHGLFVSASNVALYDCSATGGEGGGSEGDEGDGGHGAWLNNGSLFASATSFAGGRGGHDFNPFPGVCGGPGGDGLRLTGMSGAHAIGATFAGGPGGLGNGCLGPSGAPTSGPNLTLLPGVPRRAQVSSVVRPDAPGGWTVGLQGVADDRAYFLESLPPGFAISPAFHGTWLVQRASLLPVRFLGVAGPSGSVNAFPAIGDLPAGSLFERRYAQVAVRANGLVFLGSQAALLALDRESGPDCDGNGQSDLVDVLENPALDANHNLTLDSCPGG